jgi:hypothetical protein
MNFKDIYLVTIMMLKGNHNKILNNNVEEYFKNMQNNNFKVKIFYLAQRKF